MKVKFEIIEDNILHLADWADAIVNCATSSLERGGGLCNAIFKAAGDGLEEECKKYGEKQVTECVITDGYNLPCKIIHSVTNRFDWNRHDNAELMDKTYENIIKLAEENNIEKIAFPLLASNIHLYPLRIAS